MHPLGLMNQPRHLHPHKRRVPTPSTARQGLVGGALDQEGNLVALQVLLSATEGDEASATDLGTCTGVRLTRIRPGGPQAVTSSDVWADRDARTLAAAADAGGLRLLGSLDDEVAARLAPVVLWGSEEASLLLEALGRL